jgi:DTW domain-containing protein YfiP
MDLSHMSIRQLQLEAAKALSTLEATNNNIHQFNNQAHHNSQQWYKAVITWYVSAYGGLPSDVGPGKDVKLIHNV